MILCALSLLVATACDNGTAQDAASKTDSAQLQLEQETLHQANVEKCAEQMNKSKISGDTRSNHYNDRLKQCFVLSISTNFSSMDLSRSKSTEIFDPYENVRYLDCLESTLYDAKTFKNEHSESILFDLCHDQGQKFPATELQGRVRSYMNE